MGTPMAAIQKLTASKRVKKHPFPYKTSFHLENGDAHFRGGRSLSLFWAGFAAEAGVDKTKAEGLTLRSHWGVYFKVSLGWYYGVGRNWNQNSLAGAWTWELATPYVGQDGWGPLPAACCLLRAVS